MTAKSETLNNALLISLDAIFDETHRAKLMPQTETGDVKAAMMDAYFDDFAKDQPTPLMWQVRAWLGQGYPVAIVSKLPERLRPPGAPAPERSHARTRLVGVAPAPESAHGRLPCWLLRECGHDGSDHAVQGLGRRSHRTDQPAQR